MTDNAAHLPIRMWVEQFEFRHNADTFQRAAIAYIHAHNEGRDRILGRLEQ
jgi:hypothetical protein